MYVVNRWYHLHGIEHYVALFNDSTVDCLHQLFLLLEVIGEVTKAHVELIRQIAHSHTHKAFLIEKLYSRAYNTFLGR